MLSKYLSLRDFYFSQVVGTLVLAMTVGQAEAQVAITLGVDELYDSNIFLEDTKGGSQGDSVTPAPKDLDGKRNEDFITQLSLGASGDVKLTPYLKTGVAGRGGFTFFADDSSENRFQLNSVVNARTTERALPKPYYVEAASEFVSGALDVGISEGSIARQSVAHDARLRGGIERLEMSQELSWSAGYQFRRHDFLGEWTVNDRDDRSQRERGSDYFGNGVETSFVYLLSPQLSTDVTLGTEYLSFTNVESEFGTSDNEDDLDRFDSRFSTGLNYAYSRELNLHARVGLDHTAYTEDVNQGDILRDRDDTEASFAYSAGLTYQALRWTQLSLSTDQSQGTNIDGTRVIVRSVSANIAQKLDEHLDLLAGFGYSQFQEGDSFSGSTERFEWTTSARYFIAQATSLNLGYNYVDQNVDDDASSSDVFDSTPYSGHRVFLSLSSGLVGLL